MKTYHISIHSSLLACITISADNEDAAIASAAARFAALMPVTAISEGDSVLLSVDLDHVDYTVDYFCD
jgi:hypothetical protein